MIELINNHWAVEVPEGAIGLDINDYHNGSELNYWLIKGAKETLIIKDLPAGNWQIVCTSKEVTEEQAAAIVEQEGIGYKDYAAGPPENDYGDFVLSTDSLDSLLTSKGCDLNKNWLIIKKQ